MVRVPLPAGLAGTMHPELQHIADQLDAAQRDAESLVAGVSAEQGVWRPEPAAWSIAECLDHLATANTVYLTAMDAAAAQALQQNRHRRGPATSGVIGRWFVRLLEPPVNPWLKGKAPQLIKPRTSPPLADAFSQFAESQHQARTFLKRYADIDLAGVRFPNPFARGVRFSLATGLHVIPAHERRHLWQAWRVRRALQ